jgi:hypothetical protein
MKTLGSGIAEKEREELQPMEQNDRGKADDRSEMGLKKSRRASSEKLDDKQ